jgi:hypothetical protein
MEFSFECETLLGCDQEGVVILEPNHKHFLKYNNYLQICQIIDSLGNLAATVNINIKL